MSTKKKTAQRSSKKRHARKTKPKSGKRVSTKIDDAGGTVVDNVFHPSSKQVEFVNTLMEFQGKKVTVAQLCKQVKLSRAAYYKWCKEAEFVKWLQPVRNKLFETHVVFVDRVVLNKALAGDLKASKLVYEKRGELYNRLGVDLGATVGVITDAVKLKEMEEALQRMKVPEVRERKSENGGAAA